MLSDIEIAQATEPKHINDVAKIAGIPEEYIEQYGKYKAKIDLKFLEKSKKENGKLILVTAMTPTPAGEGKTTTTIGLADGLRKIGKKSIVALREPSLGPVFGVKGGACGGGYAQVIPNGRYQPALYWGFSRHRRREQPAGGNAGQSY